MNFYDQYLEQNNITRYKVAKAAGVSSSSLQRAGATDNVGSISLRVVIATAEALGKTPGQVADELIALANSAD